MRLLAALVAMVIIAGVPDFGGAGIVSAQTKTASSKKKKTSSSTSQKKNGNGQKKSSQSQKKASSAGKGQTTAKKSTAKKNSSSPKSSAEAKRMQEAAQREIQQTKEKLRLNEQEIKTGLSDLNRLSSEIAAGRTRVQGLQKKVESLNTEITSLSEEIAANESELKLMRDEYLKAVKKMRLTKKSQSALAFVFASENFNQAMRRIRYMRQFSAWKERKSSDIDKKISKLASERESLARAKDAQAAALGQLTRSQAQLEENHRKQETLVAKLRQNGDALQAHLVAKQNEANRLKETISALIAQEQAKAEAERRAREKAEAERIAKEKAEAERIAAEKAAAEKAAAERAAAEKKDSEKAVPARKSVDGPSSEKAVKEKKRSENERKKNSEKSARKKNDRKKRKQEPEKEPEKSVGPTPSVSPKTVEKTSTTPAANVNFASLRGSLPRPVDGSWRITNPFGRHAMPELPEVEYDNPGIDAEVAVGSPVKSVCGGKVSGVYKVAGYGTVVIVCHGEYYTVYGNLASTDVAAGTSVGAGQKIGTAGHDPDDAGRGSVHFEVWKGREKQNPSSWLR
ncbi:MAG: peptidoglycan DD-metalloendopeptidase family protein [Muribaculaceae bacterium]|nr:peptidoglycan DD-metalloendopeptidase family protein [Muribaculaceae bacterium]